MKNIADQLQRWLIMWTMLRQKLAICTNATLQILLVLLNSWLGCKIYILQSSALQLCISWYCNTFFLCLTSQIINWYCKYAPASSSGSTSSAHMWNSWLLSDNTDEDKKRQKAADSTFISDYLCFWKSKGVNVSSGLWYGVNEMFYTQLQDSKQCCKILAITVSQSLYWDFIRLGSYMALITVKS